MYSEPICDWDGQCVGNGENVVDLRFLFSSLLQSSKLFHGTLWYCLVPSGVVWGWQWWATAHPWFFRNAHPCCKTLLRNTSTFQNGCQIVETCFFRFFCDILFFFKCAVFRRTYNAEVPKLVLIRIVLNKIFYMFRSPRTLKLQ